MSKKNKALFIWSILLVLVLMRMAWAHSIQETNLCKKKKLCLFLAEKKTKSTDLELKKNKNTLNIKKTIEKLKLTTLDNSSKKTNSTSNSISALIENSYSSVSKNKKSIICHENSTNSRVKKAQKIVLSKLMQQIGKPYRWGGASPRTGFDCSGLVYYVYKDILKFQIPRTANEMFHLDYAISINQKHLERGDLVFFRIQGRGIADHVGVYIGNGKFIQSPRRGKDIYVASLCKDYWKRHYIGAKRVMTIKNIR